MQRMITLVAPDAPDAPDASTKEAEAPAASPRSARAGLRFGLLDNSKGNADHLLRFAVEGLRASVAIESVVSQRKDNAAKGAPAEVLDRLAAEADFVLTAMAD
ncbi:MAG: hypothetical protein ACK5TI_00840 [bacterium]|nr:hypothetical protein [Betaproteobacteria bacterium]